MKKFFNSTPRTFVLLFFSSSSLIVKLISAHTIKSGKERGGKEKKREKVFFFCSVPLIIIEYIYIIKFLLLTSLFSRSFGV